MPIVPPNSSSVFRNTTSPLLAKDVFISSKLFSLAISCAISNKSFLFNSFKISFASFKLLYSLLNTFLPIITSIPPSIKLTQSVLPLTNFVYFAQQYN